MNLFFVPKKNIKGDTAFFTDEEAHHARNVLRLKKGDQVTFTDGEGGKYQGYITVITKSTLEVEITSGEKIRRSGNRLAIGIGYIRQKQRMEFALEKLVELGIDHIGVFHGEHCEPGKLKDDRANKIIRSASKQSLRYYFPAFSTHGSLSDLLSVSKSDFLIAAHQENSSASRVGVGDISGNITGLIGPEGGFSEQELKLIEYNGGQFIWLGERRLRAETAAVSLAALMKMNQITG